jgi:SAM-dependent methyltransferase
LTDATERNRSQAFGQVGEPSAADRLGIWLSGRRIRRYVGDFTGKRIADVGCGYQANLVRSVLEEIDYAILVDIALAADITSHPKVRGIEGLLPDALEEIESASLDVILCINVLEHLWDPLTALSHIRRIGASHSLALINVPSWRGKRFLELSAFRLGLSPAEEMDDHKTYYDPRDLWPLLVRAGFVPHGIRCFRYKFGLNTFAVCRVD